VEILSPGVPPSFERTAPVVQRRKKRRKRELGNTGKKNKNWACGNYHKLRKANEECGAARDPPVSGGACTTELEAAEICVLEALINDYYTDLTCTVPPEYIADLSDCKNSDGACRTAAAGVAAMVAAFAAL